jgi:hypothetical protein
VDTKGEPNFRFWIKRSEDASAPYSLRFEVENGKGLLRVAHPDVLLDPPASINGWQEGLSSEVVRASRFLLVSAGGRNRKGYFLAALGDPFLDRLPLGEWVELGARVAGDMRLLVPLPPGGADSSVEPESVDTNPDQEPGSQRERVRQVLSTYDTPQPREDAPVVRERSWGDDTALFDFSDEHTDPSIGGDTIFLGGTEDEARALFGDALLSSASMFDAPPAAGLEVAEDDGDEEEALEAVVEGVTEDPEEVTGDCSAMATLVDEPEEPGLSGDPMPRIALSQLPIGAPRTALVRHMRRSAQRDQQRLERLEARVSELEVLLEAARRQLNERDG